MTDARDLGKTPDPPHLIKKRTPATGDENLIWLGIEPERIDVLINTVEYRLEFAANLFYAERVELEHLKGLLYRERAKFRILEAKLQTEALAREREERLHRSS